MVRHTELFIVTVRNTVCSKNSTQPKKFMKHDDEERKSNARALAKTNRRKLKINTWKWLRKNFKMMHCGFNL